MSTIVNKIIFHIMATVDAAGGGPDNSQQIIKTYNAATEDQKAVADDIFMSLTGYRLCTIVEGKESEYIRSRAIPGRAS